MGHRVHKSSDSLSRAKPPHKRLFRNSPLPLAGEGSCCWTSEKVAGLYARGIRSLRQLGSFHLPLVKSGIATGAPFWSKDCLEQKISELQAAAS